jgi:hypothetical protein
MVVNRLAVAGTAMVVNRLAVAGTATNICNAAVPAAAKHGGGRTARGFNR